MRRNRGDKFFSYEKTVQDYQKLEKSSRIKTVIKLSWIFQASSYIQWGVIAEPLYIITDWFDYKQAYARLVTDRIEGEKRQKWCISGRMFKQQK